MTGTLLALALAVLPARAEDGVDLRVEACRKGCMAAHDAKALACKLLKDDGATACLRKARRDRRRCETDCARPKPAPKAPPRAETGGKKKGEKKPPPGIEPR